MMKTAQAGGWSFLQEAGPGPAPASGSVYSQRLKSVKS